MVIGCHSGRLFGPHIRVTAQWIMTPKELQAQLAERGHGFSIGSVRRFFDCHGIIRKTKHTDTQLLVLTKAAQRSKILAPPLLANLKGEAANKVAIPLM